jgi:hypothetical protein
VDPKLQPVALPIDLFQIDDRAIIIVGGKQVTDGQVKREIAAELERLSGPPHTFRPAVRENGQG